MTVLRTMTTGALNRISERSSVLADETPCDPAELWVRVYREIDDWDDDMLRSAAAVTLREDVSSVWRARTRDQEYAALRAAERKRAAEKEAERKAKAKAELYLGRYRHGSWNKRNGAARHGCPCRWCAEVREIEERHDRLFNERLENLINYVVDSRKIEWTKELLESSFAMPDGTRVLWADATVEQHAERVEMLKKNAGANINAAARHEQAIASITHAGVTALRDLGSDE